MRVRVESDTNPELAASIEAGMNARQQLSLDVGSGVDVGDLVVGTIQISGRLQCQHELNLDDVVVLTIANADGEVIAAGQATIESVPPIAHRPAQGIPWNERRHKAKIEDEVGL